MTRASTNTRADIDEAQKRLASLLDEGQEEHLNEITQCFREILFSDSVTDEDARRAASQFSKLNPKVIGDVFRTNWSTPSTNRSDLAVGELLKLKGPKGVVRQAAVAEKLASDYPEESARIVFQILSNGRLKSSEISKATEEVLRSKFLSPKSNRCIDLKSDDEQTLKTLILTFVQWAVDTKFESPGLLHHFVKWAITNLPNAHFADAEAKNISERLDSLIVQLPAPSQKELGQLKQKQFSEASPSLPQSTTADIEQGHHKPSDQNSDRTTVPTSPVEESGQSLGKAAIPKATPSMPADTTRSLVDRAEELLELKKQEVKIYESLLEKYKDFQEQLSVTKNELEKELIRADGLSSKIETVESEKRLLKSDKEKLIASEKDLRSDLAETRRLLEERTGELESERSEYSAKIERKVQQEVESFKGRLKQNLAPLFKDKKSTDNDALTEKLADHLRTWSTKLERALRDMNIDI